MPLAFWAPYAAAVVDGTVGDVGPLPPYICPLCVLAASVGGSRVRAPPRSTLPPPLEHPIFAVDRILGHRTRPPTQLEGGAAGVVDASGLPLVAGHEHLIDPAAVAASLPPPAAARPEGEASASASPQPPPPPQPQQEWLIKWRGRSYLHCSWETLDSLVQLEEMFVNSPCYDAATGQGAGGSRAACAARVASRIERYRRKATETAAGHGGSLSDGPVRESATRRVLAAAAGGAAAAPEAVLEGGYDVAGEDADREWFDPEWTFPERIVASTARLGEDSFDGGPPSELRARLQAAAAAEASGAAPQSVTAAPANLAAQALYLVKWRGLGYVSPPWGCLCPEVACTVPPPSRRTSALGRRVRTSGTTTLSASSGCARRCPTTSL